MASTWTVYRDADGAAIADGVYNRSGSGIRAEAAGSGDRAVEAPLASAPDPDAYLVPGDAEQRRSGDRDPRIILRLVKEVADEAGVDCHAHALRAAFATAFLESKPGELVALQKLLGHSRVETTMVYLRRLNRRQAMETVRDFAW